LDLNILAYLRSIIYIKDYFKLIKPPSHDETTSLLLMPKHDETTSLLQ